MLLLCHNNILNEPILYISLYLKQNRHTYYRLLQEVRTNGNWETWLEFFLEGIHVCAKQAIETVHLINSLFDQDFEKITHIGRARFVIKSIWEYTKHLPQVTAPLLVTELKITAPTIRRALKLMVELGILEEISGKKRDKVYVYRNYLSLLEEGTVPLSINL